MNYNVNERLIKLINNWRTGKLKDKEIPEKLDNIDYFSTITLKDETKVMTSKALDLTLIDTIIQDCSLTFSDVLLFFSLAGDRLSDYDRELLDMLKNMVEKHL